MGMSIIHFIRQQILLLKLPFGANKDTRVGSGATSLRDTFPEKMLVCCVVSVLVPL